MIHLRPTRGSFRLVTPVNSTKRRKLVPSKLAPAHVTDVIIQASPDVNSAFEAARAATLAKESSSLFLLQWSACVLSIIPLGIISYFTIITRLAQSRLEQSEKRQKKQYRLYGVDISRSNYLARPSVQKAVQFAEAAHKGQDRKTGDPYITHCIHTALILENMLAPSIQDSRCETAIICAVLHDVLDDTSITFESLQVEFGNEIASAVQQISEMSSLIQLLRRHRRLTSAAGTMDPEETGAEDRKLKSIILKRLEDPLILAVKLADRLHNLRTIYALPSEKQRALASETQKIFVPLAERLGLFSLKAEMEDLCFCVLHPNEFWKTYKQVQLLWKSEKPTRQTSRTESRTETKAEETSPKHIKELLQLVTPFTSVRFSRQGSINSAGFGLDFLQKLAEKILFEIKMLSFSAGLDIDVVGRVKSLYSTYRKMKKKGIPVNEVYDILALRVVVTEDGDAQIAKEVCYKILSVVQRNWKQIPSELDDYIVIPKQSGYQSLHVAVLGPGNVPFEVQIRTASMDESAEYGHAAHWRYKEASGDATEESSSLTIRDAVWGQNAVIMGHPVIRIREGSWRDGIVIGTENEGLGIIVAVNISKRMSRSYGSYTFAVRKSYQELLDYVKKKKWSVPGNGDFTAVIERYVLCGDHAYHLLDGYGHRHATVVRPVKVFESDHSLASHLQSLASGAEATSVPMSEDEQLMKDRVAHLRSMLEYCDVIMPNGPETKTVHVVIWPEGKIYEFPRGTTAAEVLASRGHSLQHKGAVKRLVNVNNRLVQSDTELRDGDYIVLRGLKIKI